MDSGQINPETSNNPTGMLKHVDSPRLFSCDITHLHPSTPASDWFQSPPSNKTTTRTPPIPIPIPIPTPSKPSGLLHKNKKGLVRMLGPRIFLNEPKPAETPISFAPPLFWITPEERLAKEEQKLSDVLCGQERSLAEVARQLKAQMRTVAMSPDNDPLHPVFNFKARTVTLWFRFEENSVVIQALREGLADETIVDEILLWCGQIGPINPKNIDSTVSRCTWKMESITL